MGNVTYENASGVALAGSDNNVILGNMSYNNSVVGIDINVSSDNNVVSGNRATNNVTNFINAGSGNVTSGANITT